MLVGGYTLDMYCDHPGHPYNSPGCSSRPATFYGHDRAVAFRLATRAGWHPRRAYHICPECNAKRDRELKEARHGSSVVSAG